MGELIWSFIIGVHANLKNCKNILIIPIKLTVGPATMILVTQLCNMLVTISDVGDNVTVTSLRCWC